MMREARNRPLGRTLLAGLSALALGLACRPVTTRPPFPPVPEATSTEIRLPPAEAARLLGEAFRAESIPATRVELRDTWLETGWFSASTGQPVRHHRPTGSDIVRVRAWADVTHPGYCKVLVETVYRPLADPSLPQRELDRQVARDHPVAIKVRATLQDLVKRYGGPPQPAQTPTAAPEGEPGNEPQPEQPEEPSDTTTDQSR
jgi:hypothetical protein